MNENCKICTWLLENRFSKIEMLCMKNKAFFADIVFSQVIKSNFSPAKNFKNCATQTTYVYLIN